MNNLPKKRQILKELEITLYDLKKYEEAEVDVTESLPMENSLNFFQKALNLFNMLDNFEKNKCPIELLMIFERFQKNGICIERVDRTPYTMKYLSPSWTLIVDIRDQKLGVYTLGKAIVSEIKKVL